MLKHAIRANWFGFLGVVHCRPLLPMDRLTPSVSKPLLHYIRVTLASIYICLFLLCTCMHASCIMLITILVYIDVCWVNASRLRRELLVPVQQFGAAQDVPEGVRHLLPALRLRPAGHLRQRGRRRLPLLRQHDNPRRQAQVPVNHPCASHAHSQRRSAYQDMHA